MRIRDLGRILRPVRLAVAAILITAPGMSPASEETPSRPHRDAVPGSSHLGADPDHPSLRGGARGYSGVLIGDLLMGFTEGFLADRDDSERRVQGADLERMERTYREAIVSNLPPEYPISQEPGPGVLRADGLLIDHVLDKHDWLAVKTSFRSVPDVQVVVFLRDSRSNELVETVGLTLPPRGSRLMKDSPGGYWNYMRLVFDRLATRVRWALEDRAPRS